MSHICHRQSMRKGGVDLSSAWNLSLPVIDAWGSCGSPAHTLMSSLCLLLLVRNHCGPAQLGRAGKHLTTTSIFMQIPGTVARDVCFSQILFASLAQFCSFACCVPLCGCKTRSLPTDALLGPISVVQKSFFQPKTSIKEQNL